MRHSISQKAVVTGSCHDFSTPIFLSDCAAIFRISILSLSLCFKNGGFWNIRLWEQKTPNMMDLSVSKQCPKTESLTIAFKTVFGTKEWMNSIEASIHQ
jgi:hypothetical protein